MYYEKQRKFYPITEKSHWLVKHAKYKSWGISSKLKHTLMGLNWRHAFYQPFQMMHGCIVFLLGITNSSKRQTGIQAIDIDR